MKNMTKQVVILDKLSSPYIYQAIIILKSNAPCSGEKIIDEAEKIIAGYFDTPTVGKHRTKDPRRQFNPVPAALLLSCAVFITGICFFLKGIL